LAGPFCQLIISIKPVGFLLCFFQNDRESVPFSATLVFPEFFPEFRPGGLYLLYLWPEELLPLQVCAHLAARRRPIPFITGPESLSAL